ncbi:MAG: DUF3352 domain-containing protein [Nostocales cyanobacterium]|nr:MAG: DUF3352 domain-containing protein [Nostocales cyanobacterium]TAF14980.1 MAG: DUF3352 domain-containing protein [Nostocales cyanobacterium]
MSNAISDKSDNKSHKSKLLVPAISAAIVVAGGIGAYFYLKSPSGSLTPISSAEVVPGDALMATYVNTDAASWSKLQQFGTKPAQDLIAKAAQDFQKGLFADSNITYDTDIKPWIGGVMVAVLPAGNTGTTPENTPAPTQPEPNILLVVGIKDKIGALNFANKLKEQKNSQIQEIDYKGQKIIASKGTTQSTYATVLNNTHILLAPEQKAVERAIDTYKGESSFAKKEGASNLLTQGVDMKNTLAQIYIPDYGDTIAKLASSNAPGGQLPPETLKQLKQVKSMVAGVGVDEGGVRFKTIAKIDPQINQFEYQSSPGQIISQFPIDTVALVTGQNINNSWQSFLKQSKDIAEIQQGVEQARQTIKQFANLDLDKDIFSWMNGEFAFGAVKSNQGSLASVGMGGAILFDTSDRKTAEATFTKLDDLAKKQSLNITKKTVGGKSVTEWEAPFQGSLLAHGWLDEDTVFIALGTPIAQTLIENKGKTLDQSESFKTITSSLQKPNSGYFYLDITNSRSLIPTLFTANQPLPPDVDAIISSINGVGVTVNSSDKSTVQMEMLLALKPSK